MFHNFFTRLKGIFNLCIFGLMLFVLSFTQCAGFQKNQPRQAILIVLDAARPDRFSCDGYGKPTTPVMDRLAENGARFLNCYTQGTDTLTALPCLLYSRFFVQPVFPNHHSIPFASPGDLFRRVDMEAVSIPKALEEAGFLTAAIVAHEWITEETEFAREFKELYNLQTIVGFEKKYAYPRVDKVIDFTTKWLDKNRERDFFLYVHIMDTHFPHFFEDDARSFFGEGEYNESLFAPWGMPIDPNADFSEGDLKYLNSLYDGSLRYTDREIGRLIDFLGKSQILDGMLLMMTSDHGEFLLDREGMIAHGGSWYDLVAKVPLIIHFPEKVRSQVVSTICGLVDVGPTMLGLLGIEMPEGKRMDGVDLLGTRGAGSAEKKNNESLKQQAAFIGMGFSGVRTERFKCLFKWPAVRLLGDSAPGSAGEARAAGLTAEIYDMAQDPGEKHDLASDGKGADVFGGLFNLYRQKMSPLYKRHESARTSDQPELAFAISAAHFRCDQKIPHFKGTENMGAVMAEAKESVWVRRSSWDNSWLFAGPGAGPVRLSFPVPDGLYFLSVDINGCCEMEVNGMKKVLKSPEFVQNLRWKVNKVDFGAIEVRGKVFNALINPMFKDEHVDGLHREWFAIRLLGFEPIIDGRVRSLKDRERDRKREERLRALGYIK